MRVILLLAVLLAAPCFGQAAPSGAFVAEPAAEGIVLFRPAREGTARTNSLVVDRADGLLVVDAQPTPAAARELLAAVAERFSKPVRYLVLSHPHAEAAGGASAFPEETLLIASADYLTALGDPQYDFGAEARARADAPASWTEPPRRRPTLGIRATVDLEDPLRRAQLAVQARSHSIADLTVFFPDSGVLYLGGLISPERTPYAGDALIGRWLGLLNSIIVDGPRTIVSLYGPVTDLREVIALRDGFAWLRGQVEEGFVDRLAPEAIEQRVLAVPELRSRFGRGDSATFLPLLVRQAVLENVAQRKKRGLM